MAGPGNHDDLAVLLASFVDEALPFCAGIRRGVTSIFAMQPDPQAIAAAHRSLDTIAAAATVFDVPAARELSELAQLVDRAIAAAEGGAAPDDARAPLLSLVNSLEAQLNGILADDGRGQDRLANGRRLLDQVLELVASAPPTAAAAGLPPFSINLDDLLLTLQPARPAAEPAQQDDVLVPFAPQAPTPQPWAQTGLAQSPEQDADRWQSGGRDDRGATDAGDADEPDDLPQVPGFDTDDGRDEAIAAR